jgi:hypothetical protein
LRNAEGVLPHTPSVIPSEVEESLIVRPETGNRRAERGDRC